MRRRSGKTVRRDGRGSPDDMGREVEFIFFGVDGGPVLGNEGWAEKRSTYDALGNPAQWTFFGVDGGPVRTKFSFTRLTPRVRRTEASRGGGVLRRGGRPVLRDSGSAIVRFVYDDPDGPSNGPNSEWTACRSWTATASRFGATATTASDGRPNGRSSASTASRSPALRGRHRVATTYDERGTSWRGVLRRGGPSRRNPRVRGGADEDRPTRRRGGHPSRTADVTVTYGSPAWAVERIVGRNVAGEPSWGVTADFAWHREAGRLVIEADGAPVGEPAAHAAAEARVRAYEAADRMERLREDGPVLFHDARLAGRRSSGRFRRRPGSDCGRGHLLVWAGHPLDWLNHLGIAMGRPPQGPGTAGRPARRRRP